MNYHNIASTEDKSKNIPSYMIDIAEFNLKVCRLAGSEPTNYKCCYLSADVILFEVNYDLQTKTASIVPRELSLKYDLVEGKIPYPSLVSEESTRGIIVNLYDFKHYIDAVTSIINVYRNMYKTYIKATSIENEIDPDKFEGPFEI